MQTLVIKTIDSRFRGNDYVWIFCLEKAALHNFNAKIIS